MTKIVVISDTHRNQKLLRMVFENEQNYDYVFHLGDLFTDMENNLDLLENCIFIGVPGNCDFEYRNKEIAHQKTCEIEDISFTLVHDVEEIPDTPMQTEFILFGHTHKWKFEKINNIYYLNPGHLKYEFDRGKDASYATIIIKNKIVNIQWKNLEGKVFREENISKDDNFLT